MVGRDSWDGHVHTATFKMDKQQGPAVEHRGLCSMLHGSLVGRGVWGRKDTCVLNVMRQPGREGSLGRMDTCVLSVQKKKSSLGY